MRPTLVWTLFISFLSTVALGSSPTLPRATGPDPDFCAAPYEAICSAPDTAPSARRQRLEAFQQRVSKLALADTARDLGLSATPATLGALLASAGFLAEMKTLYLYYDHLNDEIAGQSDSVEGQTLASAMALIKTNLKAAYLEQAGPEEGQAMAQAIDSVAVVTTSQIRGLKSISVRMSCGLDGLAANAFAFEEGGKRYIVLCPGWVMGAVAGGADPTANLNNELQVTSHELSHHVDSSHAEFSPLYNRLAACLWEYHVSRLAPPADDRDTGACSTVAKTAREIAEDFAGYRSWERVQSHLSEIVADYWGVQATARYLNRPGLDHEARLAALREAWSGLCGSRDEGIHPNAHFRIEVLLRGDPGISEAMGCAPLAPPRGPGCTLSGPVRGLDEAHPVNR